jgi:hypothetical protein
MSFPALIVDGAWRAAVCAAMLFSLDAAAPAAAQPPAALVSIDGSVADSGLTLAAHHFDVHVRDGAASVRTRLLLRNDGAEQIAAQYRLPQPARVIDGDAWGLFDRDSGRDRLASLCGEDDLSEAESAEAATGTVVQRNDVIVVPPGRQVTVEVQREVPVSSAGRVHRLSLPLPVDRDAPWVPRFTADVMIEAERPIRRLGSPTHRALVDGVGTTAALLSVPDGFVYRQAQLTVEFELDAPRPSAPALAQSRQ